MSKDLKEFIEKLMENGKRAIDEGKNLPTSISFATSSGGIMVEYPYRSDVKICNTPEELVTFLKG